jgi:hypothetical protein
LESLIALLPSLLLLLQIKYIIFHEREIILDVQWYISHHLYKHVHIYVHNDWRILSPCICR